MKSKIQRIMHRVAALGPRFLHTRPKEHSNGNLERSGRRRICERVEAGAVISSELP